MKVLIKFEFLNVYLDHIFALSFKIVNSFSKHDKSPQSNLSLDPKIKTQVGLWRFVMFRETIDDFKRECKDVIKINVKEFEFD
jgi:hypothetical protein